MPSYLVETPQRSYRVIVERGILERVAVQVPAGAGKVFVVTTADVWELYGSRFAGLPHEVLFYPGGEERDFRAASCTGALYEVWRSAPHAAISLGYLGGLSLLSG